MWPLVLGNDFAYVNTDFLKKYILLLAFSTPAQKHAES
jgi:hypothetical protein